MHAPKSCAQQMRPPQRWPPKAAPSNAPCPACKLKRPARNVVAQSGLGDDLLDYIQAGPKLRKWYGETDKLGLTSERESLPGEEEEPEDSGPRDAVLVTDGDSALGESVILQLLLSEIPIRTLVRDAAKCKQQYGPYVEPITGDVGSGQALKAAMRGARAMVATGSLGQSARAAAALQLEHVVLLSSVDSPGGLFGIGDEDAALKDRSREEQVQAVGVPFTIVRFGRLESRIGGSSYIAFSQEEGAAPRPLSREDAAVVAVRALLFPPPPQSGLIFAAGGAGAGIPPEKDEWATMFRRLKHVSTAVPQA